MVMTPTDLREMAAECQQFNETPPIKSDEYQRLYLRITRYVPRYMAEAAAELERLTECRLADAEHLALEVSEREARGREIERLRAALTTIAAYRGRVDVAHHLAGIAEGALEYESEPPAQYPDPSPIDVEPT